MQFVRRHSRSSDKWITRVANFFNLPTESRKHGTSVPRTLRKISTKLTQKNNNKTTMVSHVAWRKTVKKRLQKFPSSQPGPLLQPEKPKLWLQSKLCQISTEEVGALFRTSGLWLQRLVLLSQRIFTSSDLMTTDRDFNKNSKVSLTTLQRERGLWTAELEKFHFFQIMLNMKVASYSISF